MGRDALRVRRDQTRRRDQRGGADRALPKGSRPLQGSEEGRVRRITEDIDRKDPEIPAARACEIDERDRIGGGMNAPHDDALEAAVLREDASGIATLTLNRPEQFNAIRGAMLQELHE